VEATGDMDAGEGHTHGGCSPVAHRPQRRGIIQQRPTGRVVLDHRIHPRAAAAAARGAPGAGGVVGFGGGVPVIGERARE